MSDLWLDLLTEADRQLLKRASFGGRVGMGKRPALLIVDAQNYMVGPPDGFSDDFPSGCGVAARRALDRLVPLLQCARQCAIPVIYTRFALRRDGEDIGVYGRKRRFFPLEGWAIE